MERIISYLQEHKQSILILAIFVVFLSSVIFFTKEVMRPRDAEIFFLNIGQGDAILIRTPHGRNILVDAGPDEMVNVELDKVLPADERDIDLAFATHPDLDHVGGFLSLLSSRKVKQFVHSGLLVGEPEYREIARQISEKHIPTSQAYAGDIFSLGDGMTLSILSPFDVKEVDDANEASLVLLLSYRGTHILLTGDAPQSVENELVHFYGDALRSSILKLGHHGSKTSSSPIFLKTVQPEYAIISAGCRNRYGHPHPEVLNRLNSLRIPYLETCWDGTLHFIFSEGGWNYVREER